MSDIKSGSKLFRIPVIDYFADMNPQGEYSLKKRESFLLVSATDKDSALIEAKSHYCYSENFNSLSPEEKKDMLPFELDFSRKIHEVFPCYLRFQNECTGDFLCRYYEEKEFCCIEEDNMEEGIPDFPGCPYYSSIPSSFPFDS